MCDFLGEINKQMDKQKKIEHFKMEQCAISKKDIDTELEDYAIILDCKGNDIGRISFYKSDILRDLIKGNGKVVADSLQKRIVDATQTMMSKLSSGGIVNGNR